MLISSFLNLTYYFAQEWKKHVMKILLKLKKLPLFMGIVAMLEGATTHYILVVFN
jgi:hypothetical protein